MTAVKLLPFVLLIGVGAFYIERRLHQHARGGRRSGGAGGLLAGISATSWSYDGRAPAAT